MRNQTELKLAKWPFLLGDALLLAAAYAIYSKSIQPMGWWQITLLVLCVAGGVCLGITPFLLPYRAAVRLAETSEPTVAGEQLRKLESVAAQMTTACEEWHRAREEAIKTAAAAEANLEVMRAKVQGLGQTKPPVNDGEKASQEFEVERLRQLEGDCLQVLVRVLDHVYALQVGALRSGQPNLIDQLSSFQDACHDAARSVGLTPFIAEPAEPFDAQLHQSADGYGPITANAVIGETIAAGYKLQGRLLRPASVRLVKSAGAESAEG